jgi:DNA recombination protein RmuC
MYDKFQGFVGSLDGVGKGLENATKSFENAKKQLTEGRGNLESQFKEMLSLSKLDSKISNSTNVEINPLIENSLEDELI